MNIAKLRTRSIPFLTVCIWGSLYIASGIVLKEIPALLLLFLRFSSSSLILLFLAKKKWKRIRREDWGLFLFIGFAGYFLSNAALLLGIQYAGGTFSSLLNATSPVVITAFAVMILKESIKKKDIAALLLSVAGAAVIIGMPAGQPSAFGIACGIFSVVSWSYVTIYIRKLSAVYPPLQVTAVGMAVAAVFSAPTAWAYVRLSHTAVHFSAPLLFPLLYICLICTALSHVMWNHSLARLGASACAAFYPLQPLVSMLLGILLLQEQVTVPFLIGMVMIIGAMAVHQQ